MRKLNGTRVYLAGPIENCPEFGQDWRKSITPFLKNLGVVVLDPTNKPTTEFKEQPEDFAKRRQLKENGYLQEVADEMKPIRAYDLRCVDISDFLITYINPTIFTVGTIEELALSNRSKKPCLTVIGGGLTKTPDWILAMFSSCLCHIFGDFLALESYIKEVDGGLDDGTERWRFFNL